MPSAQLEFADKSASDKRNSMILYVLFVMAMMIHVLFALLFFMIIWYG